MSFFNNMGSLLGNNQKANSVGNAVDAVATIITNTAQGLALKVDSIDVIEQQLQGFAQQLQQEAPALAGMLQGIVMQLNAKQAELKLDAQIIAQNAMKIDQITDHVQNNVKF